MTDTLTGWMTAMFAVAAILVTIALAASGTLRKYTLFVGAAFVLFGFAFLGIGTLSRGSTDQPVPPDAALPSTATPSPEIETPPSASGRSSFPGGPGFEIDEPDSGATLAPQSSEQYLSELSVADWNRESGTGRWNDGTMDIGGRQFGHSVSMAAGCQNDDGGDYWIEYTIGDGWRRFSGNVGLNGKSSTESSGTWQILDALTGRDLASGSLAAGPAEKFDVDVTSVTRIRLFMNNPNAPNQYCGFEKIRTVLVWGDAILAQ
ncbi:NPCBM/NEW2 domain-containing protein [Pseudonocardia sp. DLS-67]